MVIKNVNIIRYKFYLLKKNIYVENNKLISEIVIVCSVGIIILKLYYFMRI